MQRNPSKPGDSRADYRRIADIIRGQINNHDYERGSKLPTRQQLAKTHKVSLETVNRAIDVLREEGLVESRQGAPTLVSDDVDRHLGPDARIEQALQRPDEPVTIDFVGFTAASLRALIEEPLNKVLLGRFTPDSIMVRLLLPDLAHAIGLPCQADDLGDSPEFREHARDILRSNVATIANLMHRITAETNTRASVHARTFRASPLFKLFLINNSDAFFGYYPIRERVISLGNKPVPMFDLMSANVTLVHHSSTGEPVSAQHVTQARAWFENVWTTIAKDLAD